AAASLAQNNNGPQLYTEEGTPLTRLPNDHPSSSANYFASGTPAHGAQPSTSQSIFTNAGPSGDASILQPFGNTSLPGTQPLSFERDSALAFGSVGFAPISSTTPLGQVAVNPGNLTLGATAGGISMNGSLGAQLDVYQFSNGSAQLTVTAAH